LFSAVSSGGEVSASFSASLSRESDIVKDRKVIQRWILWKISKLFFPQNITLTISAFLTNCVHNKLDHLNTVEKCQKSLEPQNTTLIKYHLKNISFPQQIISMQCIQYPRLWISSVALTMNILAQSVDIDFLLIGWNSQSYTLYWLVEIHEHSRILFTDWLKFTNTVVYFLLIGWNSLTQSWLQRWIS
jgi:hypothetical protein